MKYIYLLIALMIMTSCGTYNTNNTNGKIDLIVMFKPDKNNVTGYIADLLKANGYNLQIASNRNTTIENGRLHVTHVGYESKPNETEVVLFYKNWTIRRSYNTQNNNVTLLSNSGWQNR